MDKTVSFSKCCIRIVCKSLMCRHSTIKTYVLLMGFIYALCLHTNMFGYDITIIPDLGGGSDSVYPKAMNNNGAVVGWSKTADGQTRHAFYFSTDVLIDLGTLGGQESLAWAVNDKEDVVGELLMLDTTQHAFYHHNGKMVDLTPWTTVESAYAVGVNNNGVVIGNIRSNGLDMTFIYQNGIMTIPNLGKERTQVRLQAINDKGEIIGSYFKDHFNYAFLYRNGVAQDLVYLEEVMKVNIQSVGEINNSSQITAYPLPMNCLWFDALKMQPHISPWQFQGGSMGRINDNNYGLCTLSSNYWDGTQTKYYSTNYLYNDATGFTEIGKNINGWTLLSFMDFNNANQMSAIGVRGGITNGLIISPFPLNMSLPKISQQPNGAVLFVGNTATLQVEAYDNLNSDLHYQWYFKNILLSNQTSNSIILENIQPDAVGDYYVRVNNQRGSVDSDHITLSIVSIQHSSVLANAVDVLLYGQFGKTYEIRSSPNALASIWNVETNINIAMRPYKWTETIPSTNSQRYYIIRDQP